LKPKSQVKWTRDPGVLIRIFNTHLVFPVQRQIDLPGVRRPRYLKVLLAAAEEMLISASNLPESSSRTDALQMVRAYVSNIALLMNAIELGLKAKPNETR
jgi:hypothetical protein